ncbi:MAG: 1-acyl-sn-glycerol-3-phosphate acyltransferase [Gammaproteobacteria bacterium]|nr:1-acyl-sn-glycerol-3-phosphate acyltransferase [Gammaproteobacteria bacterium]
MILRAWRVLATGFSFAVFGVGGVLIAFFLAPLVSLISFDKLSRQLRCRRIYSASFRLYILMMKALGLLSYEVHGQDSIPKGALILANHPSLLDVVFLFSLIPEANCIVKGALFGNLFTRWPIYACGYLNNDSKTLVEECIDSLAMDNELIIFPQGTRTSQRESVHFKRGAANIALASNARICLAIITCQPETLRKREHWYSVPPQPPHFTFRFHLFSYPNDCRSTDVPTSLKARRLTRALENTVTHHLNLAD